MTYDEQNNKMKLIFLRPQMKMFSYVLRNALVGMLSRKRRNDKRGYEQRRENTLDAYSEK